MARKKKRRSRFWIILGLILLALILLGMIVKSKFLSKPKGFEVEYEEVSKRQIKEKVSASGKIYPEKEIKISSDVSGEIVKLYVNEGDSVVQGQLLIKIDPDTYVSLVEQGEANLNSAKAQLANARSQIEGNKAQKIQLEASLKLAKTAHERNIALKKEGIVSEAEYENTLSTLESTKANIQSADANINSAKQGAEAAQYAVRASEAQLKELKTNLNRTSIRSPTSGIITSLAVEAGERVVGTAQMAGTEMMRVSNLNLMEVQVDVTENDILKVELNDKVEIQVDAYIDKTFIGTVTEIANSAGSNSQNAQLSNDQVTNFLVKISIDPSSYSGEISVSNPYPFRPGMSATVDIITDVRNDVLSVPIQAVTLRNADDNEEDMEEVVFSSKSDTATTLIVETGIQDDEYIEIKSGIADGQKIIKGPYSVVSRDLKDGEMVYEKEEVNQQKNKDE